MLCSNQPPLGADLRFVRTFTRSVRKTSWSSVKESLSERPVEMRVQIKDGSQEDDLSTTSSASTHFYTVPVARATLRCIDSVLSRLSSIFMSVSTLLAPSLKGTS